MQALAQVLTLIAFATTALLLYPVVIGIINLVTGNNLGVQGRHIINARRDMEREFQARREFQEEMARMAAQEHKGGTK